MKKKLVCILLAMLLFATVLSVAETENSENEIERELSRFSVLAICSNALAHHGGAIG